MEEKNRGNQINYKIIYIFLLLFISIKAQEKQNLFNVIYEDFTDLADIKVKGIDKVDCCKYTKLASFLGLKNPLLKYLGGGGGPLGDSPFGYTIASICDSEDDKIFNKQRVRYLFIHKIWYEEKVRRYVIRDTLQIPISYDFSSCLLDIKSKKEGICVGKYHQDKLPFEEYFEIEKIYGISEEGKLQLLPLSTVIYSGGTPLDYMSDEEDSRTVYYFGVKGGKKLKPYWYEEERNPKK